MPKPPHGPQDQTAKRAPRSTPSARQIVEPRETGRSGKPAVYAAFLLKGIEKGERRMAPDRRTTTC